MNGNDREVKLHREEKYVDRKDKMVVGAILWIIIIFIVVVFIMTFVLFGISKMLPKRLQYIPYFIVIAIVLICFAYCKYTSDKIMKHARDMIAEGR